MEAYAPTVHVTVRTMAKKGGTREQALRDIREMANVVIAEMSDALVCDMLKERKKKHMTIEQVREWSKRTVLNLDADRWTLVDDDGKTHDLTSEVRALVDGGICQRVMIDPRITDDEKAHALHGYNYAARAAKQAMEFQP